jgi:hypothetical protein
MPRRIAVGYTRTISHAESVNSGTLILKKTLVLTLSNLKHLIWVVNFQVTVLERYSKHDGRVPWRNFQ